MNYSTKARASPDADTMLGQQPGINPHKFISGSSSFQSRYFILFRDQRTCVAWTCSTALVGLLRSSSTPKLLRTGLSKISSSFSHILDVSSSVAQYFSSPRSYSSCIIRAISNGKRGTHPLFVAFPLLQYTTNAYISTTASLWVEKVAASSASPTQTLQHIFCPGLYSFF